MKLYSYFRSSAAYRVRIVLNIKGLSYEYSAVSLVKGEQREEAYRTRNPQGLVPLLETDDGDCLAQSLAICEYLEEKYPEPALLPRDPSGRARVRGLACVTAMEIHPLNNLRVLKYLTNELGITEHAKLAWYHHWIAEGFAALEAILAQSPATGRFCHGDTPTLADVFLVPQVFNAERFGCDMTPYPTIRRIVDACNRLPAFADAHPSRQPDAR